MRWREEDDDADGRAGGLGAEEDDEVGWVVGVGMFGGGTLRGPGRDEWIDRNRTFFPQSTIYLEKAMTPPGFLNTRRPLSSTSFPSLLRSPSRRASSTSAKAVSSPHVRSYLPTYLTLPSPAFSTYIPGITYLPASPSKTSCHQVGFYKSFGRPIAKVFLGAMFTYQITYLVWHRLEIEETKAYKTGIVPTYTF